MDVDVGAVNGAGAERLAVLGNVDVVGAGASSVAAGGGGGAVAEVVVGEVGKRLEVARGQGREVLEDPLGRGAAEVGAALGEVKVDGLAGADVVDGDVAGARAVGGDEAGHLVARVDVHVEGAEGRGDELEPGVVFLGAVGVNLVMSADVSVDLDARFGRRERGVYTPENRNRPG